ncbi:MAG TPA: hypothetical protein VGA22_14675 [Gemmatimonadales bacterium]|jgi:hypothetical protein
MPGPAFAISFEDRDTRTFRESGVVLDHDSVWKAGYGVAGEDIVGSKLLVPVRRDAQFAACCEGLESGKSRAHASMWPAPSIMSRNL